MNKKKFTYLYVGLFLADDVIRLQHIGNEMRFKTSIKTVKSIKTKQVLYIKLALVD